MGGDPGKGPGPEEQCASGIGLRLIPLDSKVKQWVLAGARPGTTLAGSGCRPRVAVRGAEVWLMA